MPVMAGVAGDAMEAGGGGSADDSGSDVKTGLWKERSSDNDNCYLYYYFWGSLEGAVNIRIPF